MTESLELIITARDMATAAIQNVASSLASLSRQIQSAVAAPNLDGVFEAEVRAAGEIAAAKIKAEGDVRAAKIAIGNDEIANSRRVAEAEIRAAQDVAMAQINAEEMVRVAKVRADATITAQERSAAIARINADADVARAKIQSQATVGAANERGLASALNTERRVANERIQEEQRVTREKEKAAKRVEQEQIRAAKAAAAAQEKAARDAERAHTASFTNIGRLGQSVMQGIGMAFGFNVLNLGQQIASGMADAVKAGIQFNDVVFKLETGFTALTKDATFAKNMVQELFVFAAQTPMTFEQVSTGAQRLLAYGWAADKVIPTLKALTDAASALGRDEYTIDHLTRALGQMQSKGHVMTQEMIQFAEAGINAWQYLADTLGVDVATAMTMVENRAVDSGIAIEGILKGMQRDFGGMAEELNKSVAGLMTNVEDYSKQILAVVFKPTYDGIRDLLYDFAFNTLPKWLEDVKKAQAGNKAVAEAGKSDAEIIKNAGLEGTDFRPNYRWDVLWGDLKSAWQAGANLFALSSAGYLNDVMNEAIGTQILRPGAPDKLREYLTNWNAARTALLGELNKVIPGSPVTQALIDAIRTTDEELKVLDASMNVNHQSALELATGGLAFLNGALANTQALAAGATLGMSALLTAMGGGTYASIKPTSKLEMPEIDELNAMSNSTRDYLNKVTLADTLLGGKATAASLAVSALRAEIEKQVSANAPKEAIDEMNQALDEAILLEAKLAEAKRLIIGGQLSTPESVTAFLDAWEKANATVTKINEKTAKDAKSAYEKEFKDFSGSVSKLLSPTSVTAGDMFKTKTGMFGGYQDKWDEYIRRLEAGVNGSKEWAHLVPENIRKMNEADRRAWLDIQKEDFYGGKMQNADWTQGGINWGAFVQSYSQSVLDEAQKQKLVDQAMAELEKAGFKGNADDVKVALGISTGGEKGAKSYAEGFNRTIANSNLPAATAITISEQTVANKEKFYAAGAAISPVVWDGIVNGTSQDLVGMMANKLVEPVVNRIIKRYGGLGSGAQP